MDKEKFEPVPEDLVEQVATELFDIWKEAKSTCEDNWDDVTWDSLPEKHKGEYRKTTHRLISLIRPSIKMEERKQIAKWGNETCPHDIFGEGTQCFKHACDMCWRSLSGEGE